MTLVQDITGRPVLAFMSTNHLDPDVAVEIFLLEPNGETPEERPTERAVPDPL